MKDKTTMIRRIPIFALALALLVLMSGCATAGPAAKSKASAALKSADLVEAAGIGAAAARETKKALVKSKKNAAVKDRLDAL